MTAAESNMAGAAPILARTVTVLFTSVGNEAIHGFIDDLRRRAPLWRLIGTDMRADSAGLYRCDHGYTVPARTDPSYLDQLLHVCREHSVDLVCPLSTEDQTFFSSPQVLRRLAPLPVMVSEHEAVGKANGKISLFDALVGHPDLLPDFEIVAGPEQALEAIEKLVAGSGAALLKTDTGSGGAGMICVGNPATDPAPAKGRRFWPLDLVRMVVQGQLDAEATPKDLAGLTSADDWPRIAIAYLPGSEYSVDVLADRGECLGSVVRLRLAADGGLATVAEVVDEPDVEEAALKVAQSLGVSYVNNIQFRRDAHGVPKLLEVNPRLPGTIGLTVEAGLNLPLAAFCLALGVRLPLPRPEIGLRVMRFFGCVFARESASAVQENE